MEAILSLIKTLEGEHPPHPRMNPTEIYNEGWMTRLLVHYSVQENITIQEIDFKELKNWTSEGLISSPFIKASKLREGYTHADMALGDFEIDFEKRGQINVKKNAKLFGILEAKMKSPLSKGTRHVPQYNQASRNIACIAYNTIGKDTKIFFGVVAPEITLTNHKIAEKLHPDNFKKEIRSRFAKHKEKNLTEAESEEATLAKLESIRTFVLSYEDWIQAFEGKDCYNELSSFYGLCKKWNRIRDEQTTGI